MTVLSGLDPDTHWSVRSQLAAILATKDPERALPRLMRMLSDSDQRVVPEVLTALTKLKAPGVVKVLLEKLQADDVGIRAAAATNLGELKPEAAADGIIDALVAAYKRGEVDLLYDVRAAVIEALSNYGPAAGVPVLKTALGDKDAVGREAWAAHSGEIEDSPTAAEDVDPAENKTAPDAGTAEDDYLGSALQMRRTCHRLSLPGKRRRRVDWIFSCSTRPARH